MGDLVRDALRATGIDEEVEQVIADALVQSWNENHLTGREQRPADEHKLKSSSTEPNIAKVRIVAEHLWKRLERIYDGKLQAWKENEEKAVEEMIAGLRREYKQNLLIKQKQLEELAERKSDEYRNKEDLLREDIRITFEKKKLECEKAWREIETAQNEIRFRKGLLESAQATFQSKKENELYQIEQERRSLERLKESLRIHEKTLDERLQEAIRKVREKDRAEMAQMVSEWNQKEAVLAKKYGIVWDKIRQISTEQQFGAREAARLKELEEEISRCRKKLTETTQTLRDAHESRRKANEDMEVMKKEKQILSEENEKLKEKLSKREIAINSLKKRLTLVEESAALRINDLKLHHRLAMDKLNAVDSELRKYRSREFEKLSRHRNPPSSPSGARTTMFDSDSLSSTTPTESSSFEQHFRDRMKTFDMTKQQLDFSVEKLRRRGRSEPLDYMQSLLPPNAETAHSFEKSIANVPRGREIEQFQRLQSSNRTQSNVAKNDSSLSIPETSEAVDVGKTGENEAATADRSSAKNPEEEEDEDTVVNPESTTPPQMPKIDPLMIRYMEMIGQTNEEKSTAEQPPAENEAESPHDEELFEIEAPEKPPDTPKTPSDFGW